MNVKKKTLKALNPDLVFRNAQGVEIVISSKTTLGQLARIGGRVELTGEGQLLPKGGFTYVGVDGHK